MTTSDPAEVAPLDLPQVGADVREPAWMRVEPTAPRVLRWRRRGADARGDGRAECEPGGETSHEGAVGSGRPEPEGAAGRAPDGPDVDRSGDGPDASQDGAPAPGDIDGAGAAEALVDGDSAAAAEGTVDDVGPLDAERRALAAERADLERARAEYVEAVRALPRTQEIAVAALEEPLLALAVAVAEALVGEAVSRDPALHQRLASAALETLADPTDARLRVSPAAHDALVEILGAAHLPYAGREIPLERDPELRGLGGIALAGPSRVDARVGERLAAALDAMVHEHRREPVAPDGDATTSASGDAGSPESP
ncbi:MAG: FliH/SctL family protein [Sandaracinaceae bacterium]